MAGNTTSFSPNREDPVSGPAQRRQWPRPLAFHVAAAAGNLMSGAAAAPAFAQGLLPLHPRLAAEGAALLAELAHDRAWPFAQAVGTAAVDRLQTFLAGVSAYQNHPYRRRARPPKPWLSLGSTMVRDYGPPGGGAGGATPVLAIPSLVNPAYILDLDTGASFVRHLKRAGFHPFLVDWAEPGPEELAFDVDDYIVKRLEPALAAVAAAANRPVVLAGYCMGGNLALALALRRPDLAAAVAFIATPWDFHAEGVAYRRAASAGLMGALAALPPDAPAPVDMLQIFFAALDPTLSERKFRRFAALDPASPAARSFVAIEDWANDGAPLVRKVAETCLHGWYGDNTPGRGQWIVAGQTVDPAALACPAFVAVPRQDRIVPPDSALALAAKLPQAEVHRAAAGHVAMMAGPQARQGLWNPLVTWIKNVL